MTSDKRPYSPYLISTVGGIITAIFTLLPPEGGFFTLIINYLAAVPLTIIFLSFGVNAGIIATFVSLSILLLAHSVGSLIVIGATHIIPCSLLATIALQRIKINEQTHWYPAGYLISWLSVLNTLYLVIGALLIHYQGSDPQTVIKQMLTTYIGGDLLQHLSPSMIELLPGLMCLSLSIMTLVNLIVAQRLCMWRKINIRPYPAKYDYCFYEFWDIVFIVAFMLVLTDGQIFAFIGKNMMLVSCFPMFFVGLSTVFCWLSQFENGRLWLGILIGLCVLLLWPAFVIVALGLLEPTMNIKKRLNVKKD
jgi:uncharacterized protein YybS (DUF2232 family)